MIKYIKDLIAYRKLDILEQRLSDLDQLLKSNQKVLLKIYNTVTDNQALKDNVEVMKFCKNLTYAAESLRDELLAIKSSRKFTIVPKLENSGQVPEHLKAAEEALYKKLLKELEAKETINGQ